MLERFAGRAADPRAFALEHRVVFLRTPSGVGLDWTYVRRRLAPLAELKGKPDIVARLEALRARLDG